ncbi:MAG: DNA cytosine methyltransferase [Caulobacteraceae bacterium]
MTSTAPTYYEFFAGGGMARAGLGLAWECLFANDYDPMKAATYAANWGQGHLLCEDVAQVRASDLPGQADLAWASFPCQDLSLAGDGLGLGRSGAAVPTRSGTFWPFWALMKTLKTERRAPRAIVLENVPGVLTSRSGLDFAAICAALADADYRFGVIVVDALHFVPQSRPRVFFIAVEAGQGVPAALLSDRPLAAWHPRALVDGWGRLPAPAKRNWLWWAPPRPPARNTTFADLVEDPPSGVRWHTKEETARLLGLMSPINRAKVEAAETSGHRRVGGVYRRTRPDALGGKRQRAEVRFDDVAGCLRTPRGGSSRQTILVVDGKSVRSRLLSPREAGRLMGLPDDYELPSRYNDAYHVAGDGVCVPAVRFIAEKLLDPLLGNVRRP